MNADSLIKRTDRIVASSINDELVMFDAEAGKYYSLNSVASNIWTHLEEPKTIRELCDTLSERFDITPEKCREELIGFLPDLEKKGLISIHNNPAP